MQDVIHLLGQTLAASPAMWIALIFVIGLIVGSFLNVVIHRVPIMLEREWRAGDTG
jgi:leader peptidase (prepilin peptidase)/N-methyltransferase